MQILGPLQKLRGVAQYFNKPFRWYWCALNVRTFIKSRDWHPARCKPHLVKDGFPMNICNNSMIADTNIEPQLSKIFPNRRNSDFLIGRCVLPKKKKKNSAQLLFYYIFNLINEKLPKCVACCICTYVLFSIFSFASWPAKLKRFIIRSFTGKVSQPRLRETGKHLKKELQTKFPQLEISHMDKAYWNCLHAARDMTIESG